MGLFSAAKADANHSRSAVQERQTARKAEDRAASVQRANDSTRTNPRTLAQIRATRS